MGWELEQKVRQHPGCSNEDDECDVNDNERSRCTDQYQEDVNTDTSWVESMVALIHATMEGHSNHIRFALEQLNNVSYGSDDDLVRSTFREFIGSFVQAHTFIVAGTRRSVALEQKDKAMKEQHDTIEPHLQRARDIEGLVDSA